MDEPRGYVKWKKSGTEDKYHMISLIYEIQKSWISKSRVEWEPPGVGEGVAGEMLI